MPKPTRTSHPVFRKSVDDLVRERRQAVAAPGWFQWHHSQDTNAGKSRSEYSVAYACDPTNVAKARAIVLRNIQRMQSQPVDIA
ncbi:MAG: hypothetical protein HY911_11365 [Desulfobacterales bacterium]|nr:hypothetical protein [Desulfobacterales bacterium]